MTILYHWLPIVSFILIISCVNRQSNHPDQPGGDQSAQANANHATDDENSTNQETDLEEGQRLYGIHCLPCHQADGTGVPRMNPPLNNTDYVLGDKERLIRITLNGSREGLNVNGNVYSNDMPPFKFLSDKEISDLLSYIRNSFGNKASFITAEEVKQVRDI